jgi:pantoate--beta-alanine ligase
MQVISTTAEMRAACRNRRSTNPKLGLVPTMGALHEGHLSLVRAARNTCDMVAASIFVNPTQFGPSEDLARYPRTLESDCELLKSEGVDVVFAPSAAEMYPTGGLSTYVDPGEIGTRLDGRSRPGHFRGVATIVSKLFNIVQPDRAFFGQKDAAQVAVLRAMVRDLDIPVEVVVCPTVRDADGLALSSRNRFLSPEAREEALSLIHALRCAENAVHRGVRDAVSLVGKMRHHLSSPKIQIDYAEVVDRDTLVSQHQVNNNTLLAIAASIGDTRLIDNLPISAPTFFQEDQL